MKIIRNLVIIGLLLIFPASQAAAKSVYCTNCSTVLIQKLQEGIESSQLGRLIAQYKEAVKQTALQLQMVQTEINQYLAMVQGLAQLPQELIGEVAGMFSELAALTSQLNTLRGDLMGLGSMFTELYPDFTSLKELGSARTAEDIAKATEQYSNHWDKWSERVDEATEATFKLTGIQLKAFEKDSTQFQAYINKLLSTPDGQQKALMAGNQLTALQINETRQIHELMATNIQRDIANAEKGEKESQIRREVWKDFMKTENLEKLTVNPDPF